MYGPSLLFFCTREKRQAYKGTSTPIWFATGV